jgi:hypothetical protein
MLGCLGKVPPDRSQGHVTDYIIQHPVTELGKQFKLRDLGPTTFLLGVEITRKREEKKLYLSQRQYIVNKLEEFHVMEYVGRT